MNTPTPAMIKKIHWLKSLMKMEDDEYRIILESYCVKSSKELSERVAIELIGKLESMAISSGCTITVHHGKKKATLDTKRWDFLGNREDMATPVQLRHIEGLWVQVSKQPTLKEKQDSLHVFLKNRFGIGRVEWLREDQVSKVKRAIAAMIKRGENE